MLPADMALIACLLPTAAGMVLTAREARTAPASTTVIGIAGAVFLAMIFWRMGAQDPFGWKLMVASAVLLAIALPIWLTACLTSSSDDGYRAEGEDLEAIRKVCDEYDAAQAMILAFEVDRTAMPLLQRFADAFVTTPAERRNERARGRVAEARNHLHRTVPCWKAVRIEALLDASPDDRQAVDAARRDIEPFETSLAKKKHMHALGAAAIETLTRASSDLGSAQTYEVLDIASSNKAMSAISTAANSTAKTSVKRACEAVSRLSEAVKSDVQARIDMPDDMVDFILDMAIDLPLDIFSIINLGRLRDAKTQCDEALVKVRGVEAQLHTHLMKAQKDIEPYALRLKELLEPFERQVLAELPATARLHSTGGDCATGGQI